MEKREGSRIVRCEKAWCEGCGRERLTRQEKLIAKMMVGERCVATWFEELLDEGGRRKRERWEAAALPLDELALPLAASVRTPAVGCGWPWEKKGRASGGKAEGG